MIPPRVREVNFNQYTYTCIHGKNGTNPYVFIGFTVSWNLHESKVKLNKINFLSGKCREKYIFACIKRKMRAETVYNVIEALSESELKRLYSMLEIKKMPKAPKKKSLITEAQAIEYILNLYKRQSSKNYI